MKTHFIKPNWDAPAHIHAYSSTRAGGVSQGEFSSLNVGTHVGDNPLHVIENRAILSRHFANAPDFCWLNQTHSSDLIKLSATTVQGLSADASWIDNNTRTCVVMSADCLPVLITDQQGSFVAAIHAGWRGLYNGIIERSIKQIKAQINTPNEQLLVWLGPCISQAAFEVGDEVRAQFIADDPNAHSAFIAYSDKWLADLQQLARLRLAKFPGVQISNSHLCTYNDSDLLFSYRRNGKTGRLATFIWIQ